MFVFVFAVVLFDAVFWQAAANTASTNASDKLDINVIFIFFISCYCAVTGIAVFPLPAEPSKEIWARQSPAMAILTLPL